MIAALPAASAESYCTMKLYSSSWITDELQESRINTDAYSITNQKCDILTVYTSARQVFEFEFLKLVVVAR